MNRLLVSLGAFAIVAVLLVGCRPVSANEYVATANNGTIKIHEQGTPSGTESNDPKVCVFNVEGFGFDAGQTGYLFFNTQGGDAPTGSDAGPFYVGPADSDGYFETEYYTLEPGHYKATLYGKFGDDEYSDVKAKSKVFKVECAPEETPAATPEVTPEVTPEATPEVTPEVTPEATPEVTPEATPRTTPVQVTEQPFVTPVPPEDTAPPTDIASGNSTSGGNPVITVLALLAFLSATVLTATAVRSKQK